MAATVTIERDIAIGQTEHLYELKIAFDSSYPTGGETVDVALNSRFSRVNAQPTSGYVFQFDPATQKLLAYYGDNNNAADGPLIQVPDTTDLSALTSVLAIALGA